MERRRGDERGYGRRKRKRGREEVGMKTEGREIMEEGKGRRECEKKERWEVWRRKRGREVRDEKEGRGKREERKLWERVIK